MSFWQRRKFESGTKTKEIKGFITFEIPIDFDDRQFLQELANKTSKSIKGHKDYTGKIKFKSINIFFD